MQLPNTSSVLPIHYPNIGIDLWKISKAVPSNKLITSSLSSQNKNYQACWNVALEKFYNSFKSSDSKVSAIEPADCIRISYLYSQNKGNKNIELFKKMTTRLIFLASNSDLEEDECPVTGYAYDYASNLISEFWNLLPEKLPEATISVGDGGGIRIEWAKKGRHLRFIVPSSENERGYIYHQEKEYYNVEWNIEIDSILHYLNWYIQES